jgi:hypothetical protein
LKFDDEDIILTEYTDKNNIIKDTNAILIENIIVSISSE